MLKRPHYLALGVVLLLTLTLLNLPSRTTGRLKLAIGSLFLPLFGLAGSAQQVTAAAGDNLLPRRELLKMLERLRQENQQLQLQARQAQDIAGENARLRQLLGWQAQQPWKFKLAKVVLREPANWWRSVQIDLGSRDGLRANLPVLTSEGLVGRVASVSLTRSQVVLLGDPNCKVSARVENPARDIGVLGSAGPLEPEFVALGCLSGSAKIRPGQNVVTSGEGGIFPSGIPIGQIVDVQPVDYGSRAEARVRLAANLSALEEVWVLIK
jgi:rod shape-determining protein MreC